MVQGQNTRSFSKMHRPQLYRLQYQKKLWGNLKKFWRKKMFSLKSMTKLEDLTVLFISGTKFQGPLFGELFWTDLEVNEFRNKEITWSWLLPRVSCI